MCEGERLQRAEVQDVGVFEHPARLSTLKVKLNTHMEYVIVSVGIVPKTFHSFERMLVIRGAR